VTGRRTASLACAAALLAAACAPRDGANPPPQGHIGPGLARVQVLRRGIDPGGVHTLDPSLSTDVPAERILDDIFEGLTRLDQQGEPAAGVAERWEQSPDGRTWTFHLRAATWSNGVPVRSSDFVFAWRRTVDPHTASEYAQALAPVVNAVAINEGRAAPETLGIEAPDERTVRVRLAAPTPYLLALLTKSYTFPQYAPAVTQWGAAWTQPGHIVGNGAFVLREHQIGGRVSVERNPRYWNAAQVRLSGVVYYPLDRTQQTDRYFAGEVDYTDSFSANQLAWLRGRLGDQVVHGPYLGNFVVGVNYTRPPLGGNRALRMALTLAVDREILVRYVRQGLYLAAYTPTPPLPGYAAPRPQWADLPDAQRHALAQRYYREAGYSREHPLRLELRYATDSDNRRIFEALAAMWRSNLGAEIAPYNEEFRVLLNERHLHKLDLYSSPWIGDYPDPYTFLQLFHTGVSYNDGGYSNPRYDALLDAAGLEPDAQRRYALLAQAEQLLDDDAACIPLYYYASRHLVKPWVRGWSVNIQDRNLSQYMYLLEHEAR
jgi:oligopeptide transport system substrate-binding protein